MSKRISALLIFSISLLVFAGCNATKIPAGYLPNPRAIKKSVTGSWIEVTINSVSGDVKKIVLAGELVAVHFDTLFILSDVQLSFVKRVNIDAATLYIFKNQGGKYALLTGLLIVPDIIGAIAYSIPAFLLLGIPVFVVGTALTIVEGTNESNRLIYPGGNSFDEFRKYARFPAGLPPSLNRNELHLLKTK
jgi:hypothetical protein